LVLYVARNFICFIIPYNGKWNHLYFSRPIVKKLDVAAYTILSTTNLPRKTISMKAVNALTLTNQNGGFYECGRHYGLAGKRQVALAYLQLREEKVTFCPPVVWAAKRAKVGWHYANSVIKELRDNGESLANLIDPAIIHHNRTINNGEYRCFLSHEEEMHL
jgi:hypothetical protein